MERAGPPEARFSTADKVAALRLPACYPEPTQQVEAIESHMSWVFLTDGHAWKLKKPVRYDHQDFSTAAGRHFYCLEELRLNRRLAAPVYLDVVALRVGADGRLRLGGEGIAVDWLVKMRRLPAQDMLDALLARGAATPQQLRAVAQLLCAFYRGQPAAPLGGRAYRALLLRQVDEYERELCDPAWTLPVDRIRWLCGRQRALLGEAGPWLEARVAAGWVVEAHGDLRPEHVYLGEPLAIIDCLEFSGELRLQDSADEVGFLALECERAGAAGLGRVLLEAYRAGSGDAVPAGLVHLYQSCRACVRARLAIAHLRDAQHRGSPRWERRARQYLALALLHLRHAGAALQPSGFQQLHQ